MTSIQQQEPLSWFTLDRYHLGQLSETERACVEARLASCAESRARLDEVRTTLDLKPLDLHIVPMSRYTRWTQLWSLPGWAKAFVIAGATAIAVSLGLLPITSPQTERKLPDRFSTKGGVITFSLIRQRGETVSEDPTVYSPEDTFMVAVTCPVSLREEWNIVVFADGEASTPFASPAIPRCGNRVLLEGAFGLRSHAPVDVCLVWGGLENASRHKMTRDKLHGHAVCKTLEPVRE